MGGFRAECSATRFQISSFYTTTTYRGFNLSQQQLFKTPRAKSKAVVFRRRLRHRDTLPGRIFLFDIYSMTRAGRDIEHHQEADIHTGTLRCSCEDFEYRHARHKPTIGDPTHVCKHLTRVLDWLLRKRFLHGHEVAVQALMRDLRPCCECGVADAHYGLCDERGFPLDGFICRECWQSRYGDATRPQYEAIDRLDQIERWLLDGERELKGLEPILYSNTPRAARTRNHYDALCDDLAVLRNEHEGILGALVFRQGVFTHSHATRNH